MRDGSFLAVRKLRQDVEALDNAMSEAVATVSDQVKGLAREDLIAKILGRWPTGWIRNPASRSRKSSDPDRSEERFSFRQGPDGH